MPPSDITCPQCRQILKLPRLVPPGAAVRCPRCNHGFAVPAHAIRVGPASPAPPPGPPLPAPPPAGGSRGLTLALVFGAVLLFLGVGFGLAVYCLSGDGGSQPVPPAQTNRDTSPVPAPPPPPPPPWLPEAEQLKVDEAIVRGVGYLKKSLATNFSVPDAGHNGGQLTGALALAGLTLLNCDVPVSDPTLARVIARVRAECPRLQQTYDLGACIWLLDRLNDAQDRALLRSIGLRLVAGQDNQGGWPYVCPLVPADLEGRLVALLRSPSPPPADTPAVLANLPVLRYRAGQPLQLVAYGGNTNSLTLFAMLGLWAARKHDVPVDRSLAFAEARFRASQNPDGSWFYQIGLRSYTFHDSMTCAGLLALAVGRGIRAGKLEAHDQDQAIARAFRYLGGKIGKPAVRQAPGAGKIVNADAWDDLYFFWAVERVAVVYDLRRIEGKEWYPWGANILVRTQNADGSWSDRFAGVADTCFALLFLKRVNVAQDLTEKLKLSG